MTVSAAWAIKPGARMPAAYDLLETADLSALAVFQEGLE